MDGNHIVYFVAGFVTACILLGIIWLTTWLLVAKNGNKTEQSELDKFRHGEIEPSQQQQGDNLSKKLKEGGKIPKINKEETIEDIMDRD